MQIPSVWLLRMRFHIFLVNICSQSWGRATVWGRFQISTTSRCWAQPQPVAQRSPPDRSQPPSQAGYAPLKQVHKTSADSSSQVLLIIGSVKVCFILCWVFNPDRTLWWLIEMGFLEKQSSERFFILRPVRVKNSQPQLKAISTSTLH